MVNAPPTPPPTSSQELRDLSGEQQQEIPQVVQQPTNLSGPDPYQAAFPTLAQAISQQDWLGLVKKGEEIDISTPGELQVTRLLIIAPLVVGYLIQDNIQPARHAIERLPENLAKFPLTALLLTLINATHNRAHSAVYSTVDTLITLVTKPDFIDAQLGSTLTQLLSIFAVAFKRRTFELLSQAYSSLPMTLAQVYLEASEDDIVHEGNMYGWTYEPSTQIFTPRRNASREVTRSPISSLTTLHLVATSVGNLEA